MSTKVSQKIGNGTFGNKYWTYEKNNIIFYRRGMFFGFQFSTTKSHADNKKMPQFLIHRSKIARTGDGTHMTHKQIWDS